MRAIWKGHISFGLINVPVNLYAAEQRSDLTFHMIDSRDFARVRYERVKARRFDALAFFAFDLPYCNGYDLTATPLGERKALLHRFIPESDKGILRFSDHVAGDGKHVQTQACKLGLEGIVSKHAANAPQRLARLKADPWAGYFRKRQQLTAARIEKMESIS